MASKTNPLRRLLLTAEGVVLIGADIALVVAPIVSSSVNPNDAIKWGAIMNSVAFGARQALKGVAALKGFGLDPDQLLSIRHQALLERDAGIVAGQAASDVSKGAGAETIADQVTSDAEKFAGDPPPIFPVPPASS